MERFSSVDEYKNSFDGVTKERLIELEQIILTVLPGATSRISYNIPVYAVDDERVVFIAGYDRHVGLYPGRNLHQGDMAIAGKYAHGKSTLRFVHDEPLPVAVIERFVRLRLDEVTQAS